MTSHERLKIVTKFLLGPSLHLSSPEQLGIQLGNHYFLQIRKLLSD